MKWIKILPAEMYPVDERGYYIFPQQMVLAKNEENDLFVGYLEWRDEMGDCYTACSSREGYFRTNRNNNEPIGSVQIRSELTRVTHYILAEDLLNLEKE